MRSRRQFGLGLLWALVAVPAALAAPHPSELLGPGTLRASPAPAGPPAVRWQLWRYLHPLRQSLTLPFVDLWLPGRGAPLALRRTYHGRADEPPGPLGPGWSASYAMRLELEPQAQQVRAVRESDGERTPYVPAGPGRWVPLAGTATAAPLVRLPGEEGYERRWPDGWRERFDARGRLARIEPPQGGGVELLYPQDAPSALPQVLRAEDGRQLVLAHTGSRLRAVSDPLGRTVHYGYDALGRLAWVRDALGRTTRLAYAGDGTRLQRLEIGGGPRLSIAYDPRGRPVELTGPSGEAVRVRWIESTDPPARGFAWQGAGGARGELRLGIRATEPEPVRAALPAAAPAHPAQLVLSLFENEAVRRCAVLEPAALRQAGTRGPPAPAALERGRTGDLLATSGEPPLPALALGRLAPQQVLEAAPQVLVRDAAGRPVRLGPPEAPHTLCWDAADRLISWRGPDGALLMYEHDARDRLRRVRSAGALLVELRYDAQERLLELELPGGARWRWERDTSGRPLRLHGPDGPVRSFVYAADGTLQQVLDAQQQPLFERQALPAGGVRLRLRAGAGQPWTEEDYDASGRLVAWRGPELNARLEPDAGSASAALHLVHADGLEQWLRLEQAQQQLLLQQRSADGTASELTYDLGGRLQAVRTQGVRLQLAYDEAGRLVRIAEPSGWWQELRYDEAGRLRERRSAGEPRERWSYDEAGRLVRYERGLEAVERLPGPEGGAVLEVYAGTELRERLVLGPDGELCAAQQPDGAETVWLYDPAGRLRLLAGPFGRLALERDPQGRLRGLSTQGELGAARWEFEHQPGGAVRVRDPEGQISVVREQPGGWAWEHPLGGRWQLQTGTASAELIGPLGVQRSRRDPAGRLLALQDPLAGSLRVHYPGENLAELTDPAGARWRLTFDGLGALQQLEGPLGHVQRWQPQGPGTLYRDPLGGEWYRGLEPGGEAWIERDPFGVEQRLELDPQTGLVRGWQRPGGERVRMEYGPAGLLRAIELQAGRRIELEHDARGRLVRARGPDGDALAFRYDELDRIVELAQPGAPALALAYDVQGLVAEIGLGGEERWRYRYDALGRLVRLELGAGSQRCTLRRGAAGRPLEVVLPGGGRIRYRYEGARPAELLVEDASGRTSYFERYRFDAAGRLVAWSDPDGEHRFEYDALGRLVLAQWADGTTERFRYDPAGNALEQPGGRRLRYDRAQRLVACGEQRLEHDPAGRLLLDAAGRRYRYDALDRLLEVELPGGGRVRYGYDALGRLAWREQDGERIEWLWLGADRVAELGGRGRLQRRFVPGPQPGLWLAQKQPADPAGQWWWAVRTLNGSLVALVDGAGRVRQRHRYLAYGGPRAAAAPAAAAAGSFAGGLADPQLPLVFFGGRAYHTGLGRFLTPEPQGHDLLGGRYVYALANPLLVHDRSGARPRPVLGLPERGGPAAWPVVAGIRGEGERRLVLDLIGELEGIARREAGPIGELAESTLDVLRRQREGALRLHVRDWYRAGGKLEPSVYGLFRPGPPPRVFVYTGPAAGDRHEMLKTLVHELVHLQQAAARMPLQSRRAELGAFYAEFLLDVAAGKRPDLMRDVVLAVERNYPELPGPIRPEDLAAEIRRWSPTLHRQPKAVRLVELERRYARYGVEQVVLGPRVDRAASVQRQLQALRQLNAGGALSRLALRQAEPLALPTAGSEALERALARAARRARWRELWRRGLRGLGRLGAVGLRMAGELLEPGLQALMLYDAYALLAELGDGVRELVRELLEQGAFGELLRVLEQQSEPSQDEERAGQLAQWVRRRVMHLGFAEPAARSRSGAQAVATASALGAAPPPAFWPWISIRTVPGRRHPRGGGIVGALEWVGASVFGGAGGGRQPAGTAAASAPARQPAGARGGQAASAPAPASAPSSAVTPASAGYDQLMRDMKRLADRAWRDAERRWQAEERARQAERQRQAERERRAERERPPAGAPAADHGPDTVDLGPVPEPERPGLVRWAWNALKGGLGWLFGRRSADSAAGQSAPSVAETVYGAANPYYGAARILEERVGRVLREN
ncbi:MAG: hypothetical protein KatS3mg102_2036 [Planctomycetota bacterium]|nr:MAG: hypothetical protein KatS3mg102_2036 [Planctomycetota bacterium]